MVIARNWSLQGTSLQNWLNKSFTEPFYVLQGRSLQLRVTSPTCCLLLVPVIPDPDPGSFPCIRIRFRNKFGMTERFCIFLLATINWPIGGYKCKCKNEAANPLPMIIYERLPPRLSPDWRLCNKTVTHQLESPSSKLMPRGRCQLPYPFPVRPI